MLGLRKKTMLFMYGIFYPLIRALVSKAKRDPEIVVFFKHSTFEGNVKYQFLYSVDHLSAKVVFLTLSKELARLLERRGYEARYLYSSAGINVALKTGVIVADDGLPHHGWFKWGSQLVEIWHGGPLKKSGYDDEFDVFYNPPTTFWQFLHNRLFKYDFEMMDWFITTSQFFGRIFQRSMKLKNVLNFGAPRTDIFFQKIPGWELNVATDVLEEVMRRKGRGAKVLLYAPTFRRRSSLDETKVVFQKEIVDWVKNTGNVILLKLHWLSLKRLPRKLPENFLVVPPTSDIYPILPHVDLLITDYSSIFYDYLLLDKPIIFYAEDYEEYVKRERRFYFDYRKFVPGEIAYTPAELLEAIERNLNEPRLFQKKREEVRKLAFDLKPGVARKRINKFLRKLLEKIS